MQLQTHISWQGLSSSIQRFLISAAAKFEPVLGMVQ
jgi:hypothetical protein